jgi:tetratricopeptide (TPR) repeat protein
MKINENAFNFATKLFELNKKENEKLREIKIDQKRIIGTTDYKKFEDIQLETEFEELRNSQRTKDALKILCKNAMKKEKQQFEQSFNDKLDACKTFKNEGDDLLKKKKFEEAVNSYEKALLQLFYSFSEDPEEDKAVNRFKSGINMNVSMCKMNIGKYDEAINCCLEALRVDSKNLKAIYRVAFSYFKIDNYDKARNYINDALKIEPNEKLFLELKKNIEDKEKENDMKTAKIFRKILK